MLTKLELEDLRAKPHWDINEQQTKSLFEHIDELTAKLVEMAVLVRLYRPNTDKKAAKEGKYLKTLVPPVNENGECSKDCPFHFFRSEDAGLDECHDPPLDAREYSDEIPYVHVEESCSVELAEDDGIQETYYQQPGRGCPRYRGYLDAMS